jgi:hypothetical protein
MVLHLLILLMLIFRFDYLRELSLRHLLVLAGLSLPFSAAGVMVVLSKVAENKRVWAGVVLVIVLIGPTLPWMLETRYADEAYLRRAGEWIRQNSEEDHVVMTDLIRVAYYADGHLIRVDDQAAPADIMARARAERPDWLVFTKRDMLNVSDDFAGELMKALQPAESLIEAHAEPGTGERNNDHVIVYRYRTEDSSPGERL